VLPKTQVSRAKLARATPPSGNGAGRARGAGHQQPREAALRKLCVQATNSPIVLRVEVAACDGREWRGSSGRIHRQYLMAKPGDAVYQRQGQHQGQGPSRLPRGSCRDGFESKGKGRPQCGREWVDRGFWVAVLEDEECDLPQSPRRDVYRPRCLVHCPITWRCSSTCTWAKNQGFQCVLSIGANSNAARQPVGLQNGVLSGNRMRFGCGGSRSGL
jgi:hypothetical protein